MAPVYPVPAFNNTAAPSSAPPAYNATAAAPVSVPVPTAGVSYPTQAAFNATAGSGWYFGIFLHFSSNGMIFNADFSRVRLLNRLFAVNDHMVQKPPCWRANCPLGHPKQSNLT